MIYGLLILIKAAYEHNKKLMSINKIRGIKYTSKIKKKYWGNFNKNRLNANCCIQSFIRTYVLRFSY